MKVAASHILDVQDLPGPYWYVICHTCGLTWYLPKDERKRTPVARDILREHAQTRNVRGAA